MKEKYIVTRLRKPFKANSAALGFRSVEKRREGLEVVGGAVAALPLSISTLARHRCGERRVSADIGEGGLIGTTTAITTSDVGYPPRA